MWNTFDISTNGGFMSSSQNAGSATKKKEQMRRVQSIVPLFISHIKKCRYEELTLCGMPVQIADIVGVIRNFSVQSTKASCTIEDQSGSIQAILWLETDGDSISAVPPVKENCYVRVFGSIRNQEGVKMIMILKIIPIDDVNIIINHHLLVVHSRAYARKLAQGAQEIADVNTQNQSTMSYGDIKLGGQGGSGLKPMQGKILSLLQKCSDYMGLSKDDILKHFSSGQAKEVQYVETAGATLDFLLDEGHAYTTCDSDHYKATDSC